MSVFVAVYPFLMFRTIKTEHEYFAETSCDKDSVILQEGETIAYRWIDRETLLAMKGELLTHRMWQFVPELQD